MNILCFGDSNTYGISPVDGKRFAADERWRLVYWVLN